VRNFDENLDEDIKGEVESVILEMVDKLELELEEQVITEITEEQEPVIKEKKFKCELCKYSGKDQYALNRHLKTKKHTDKIK